MFFSFGICCCCCSFNVDTSASLIKLFAVWDSFCLTRKSYIYAFINCFGFDALESDMLMFLVVDFGDVAEEDDRVGDSNSACADML